MVYLSGHGMGVPTLKTCHNSSHPTPIILLLYTYPQHFFGRRKRFLFVNSGHYASEFALTITLTSRVAFIMEQQLDKCFPFLKRPTIEISEYFLNVLHLATLLPSGNLKTSVWKLLSDKLMEMDVKNYKMFIKSLIFYC